MEHHFREDSVFVDRKDGKFRRDEPSAFFGTATSDPSLPSFETISDNEFASTAYNKVAVLLTPEYASTKTVDPCQSHTALGG